MADFEYLIFDGLKKAMPCECGSIESNTPPSLPFVAFEQLSNPVSKKHLDSGSKPMYYAPQFRVTAYVSGNDKVKAKRLLQTADEYLMGLGLLRTFGPQRVTTQAENVTKMISLYEGNLISTDGRVYTE